MNLAFEFTGGRPPVDFTVDTLKATPVELQIAKEGSPLSRKQALEGYVRTLDYLFRGVSNYVGGGVFGATVSKAGFGTMSKAGHALKWDAVADKMFLVVYELSHGEIAEHMYLAEGIYLGDKKKKVDSKVAPVYIKELLDPQVKSPRVILDEKRIAVSVVTEFIKGYKLQYVPTTPNEGRLVLTDAGGKEITTDIVEDDESYTIIKLLDLLMAKGHHQGVFLLNAAGFSDQGLKAISTIVTMFFGDTFFFIYNCPDKSQLERKKVVLPNFTLPVK